VHAFTLESGAAGFKDHPAIQKNKKTPKLFSETQKLLKESSGILFGNRVFYRIAFNPPKIFSSVMSTVTFINLS
jgi:hypothetical protein